MSMFIIMIFLNFPYLFSANPIIKVVAYLVIRNNVKIINKVKKLYFSVSCCRKYIKQLVIKIINIKYKNLKKLKFVFLSKYNDP